MPATDFSEIREYLECQLFSLENYPLELDVSTCADANEFASTVADTHLKAAIHARNAMQIRDIRSALRKMQYEGYGYCEECGDPISLARLKARPTATLCVECQNAMETSLA